MARPKPIITENHKDAILSILEGGDASLTELAERDGVKDVRLTRLAVNELRESGLVITNGKKKGCRYLAAQPAPKVDPTAFGHFGDETAPGVVTSKHQPEVSGEIGAQKPAKKSTAANTVCPVPSPTSFLDVTVSVQALRAVGAWVKSTSGTKPAADVLATLREQHPQISREDLADAIRAAIHLGLITREFRPSYEGHVRYLSPAA